MPGAVPKGAGSHMASTWAAGSLSTQDVLRWATGLLRASSTSHSYGDFFQGGQSSSYILYNVTMVRQDETPELLPWSDKHGHVYPECSGMKRSSCHLFHLSKFTACSKQEALTAHGCHSKGCKSWGQQKGGSRSKNNSQLREREESSEPALASPTRLTVYIPLLMVTHSPLVCAGSSSGRRGNATWIFLFWRPGNCKIDQITPTCLNISQPL